jgi:hypothetical protein
VESPKNNIKIIELQVSDKYISEEVLKKAFRKEKESDKIIEFRYKNKRITSYDKEN